MRLSMAHLGASAAVALLAGLAGCNSGADGGRLALTGASYCTPFQKTAATSSSSQSGLNAQAAVPASDPGAAFDDCIHRWAYAMAPARDPADIVAHAAVDACGAAMNAWNQQASAQNPNAQYGQDQNQYQDQGPYGPSSRGREPQPDMQQQMQQAQNSPIAQHMQIAQARSLFYVIQARAAGCAPPPASTLVSAPTTQSAPPTGQG